MKRNTLRHVAALLLIFALRAGAQGTAFTYQGLLNQAGAPANGVYDLSFTLYTAESGGLNAGSTNFNDLAITNGLLNVTLDFGDVPFIGADRWLEIGVRPGASSGAYTNLAPRQPVNPTPYAIFSRGVNSSGIIGQLTDSQLSTTLSFARTFSNPGNLFFGSGSNLTALDASQLASGTVADARLSTNVALLNASNTFTGTIRAGSTFIVEPRPNNVPANNVFIGFGAGVANTNGVQNTFVGNLAGNKNTSGGGNAFFGTQAGFDNLSGNSVTFLGNFAGLRNRIGAENTFVGAGAGEQNTNGSQNTYVGTIAGRDNRSGNNNIAVGRSAGLAHTSDSNNIDIGHNGVAGESGTIRIGTPGIHTNLHLAGVINGNGANLTNLSAPSLSGTVADSRLSANVALRAGGNTFSGNQTFNAGNLSLAGSSTFEFGAGVTGKEINAGKIGYETFTPGALDIVGAGTNGTGRLVQLWDQVHVGNYNADGSPKLISFGDPGYVSIGENGDDDQMELTAGKFIFNNGNVGIGGTNAPTRLTVNQPGYGIEHTDGTVRIGTYVEGSGAYFGTVSPHDLYLMVNDNSGAMVIRTNNNTEFFGEITTTAVNITSDRNAKEQFKPVNARDVLDKVARLPISEWQYKTQTDARHIGPMAQDFHAAFAVGRDEKHITSVDADGVALAAIQGLNEKFDEQTREKDARIHELERTVAELKELVGKLAGQQTGGAR